MDNETKRLYEAAENYAENKDILMALEEHGFTLDDLARALEITPKKLEKTLHEPLQYDNRHEHIMRTIERMASIS